MTDPIRMEAREYKLLLNAARFGDKPSTKAANAFWDGTLKPIVETRLDRRSTGDPRWKGAFGKTKRRQVRFWDTGDRDLTNRDFVLRQRAVRDGDGGLELTVKLRTPDIFLAAAASLAAEGGAEPGMEEDIAPLEVGPTDGSAGVVTMAHPRSIRSRFARSAKVSAPLGWTPGALVDLFGWFPTLQENLLAAGGELDIEAALRAGPEVEELVLEGAEIALGDEVKAELDLTFWKFVTGEPRPDVAEISFKCDLKEGRMPPAAARRALRLFTALQEDLGVWLETRTVSKTSLALPPPDSG